MYQTNKKLASFNLRFNQLVHYSGSKSRGTVTNSKNQVDPLTLHGGCPVLKGEKWIATKWMRQNEYR